MTSSMLCRHENHTNVWRDATRLPVGDGDGRGTAAEPQLLGGIPVQRATRHDGALLGEKVVDLGQLWLILADPLLMRPWLAR